MVEELVEKLNRAVSNKAVKKRSWKIGYRKWWDKECMELKRETRRALKKWRRGVDSKVNYEIKKKKFKEKCKEKKRELQEREELEIQKIKNENQVWEYINRGRKDRIEITKNIKTEEWRAHFMKLLEGEEVLEIYKVETRDNTGTEDNEERITGIKIRRQIAKLKNKKAPGEDGLENEVWINGNRKIIQRLGEIINRIWDGEKLPERWREG